MNPNHDAADAATDRNLRRLVQSVSLPAEPTLQQTQAWKAGRDASARRRPLLAFFGGGTAIAACLALSAMLFVSPSQPRVQAATILQNLNEAMGRAFRLVLNDLPDRDGGKMDGEFTVAFDPQSAGDQAESIFCEGWQRSDVTAGQSPPIDIRFAFAGLPDQAWVFLRTAAVPDGLLKDSPLAQMLVQWASGGVLIDLSGLPRTHTTQTAVAPDEKGGLKVIKSHDAIVELHRLLGIGKHQGKQRLEIGLSTGTPNPKDPDKSKTRHSPIFSFEVKTSDPSSTEATRAAVGDVNQLAGRLLHGRAGAADIRHFFEVLQKSATNVSVEEREPGLHVLTASGFNNDDPNLAIWLGPNTTYSVVYREGSGVESASVENIGATNGSIHFETIDFKYDEATHGRQRFAGDGQTHVLDFAALLKAIEPFFNSESKP